VRDSGFKDAKSREQLFDAMELNTTQQAKLGLAIDISKGNLDMESFEDSKYFKEIDMTPEQVDVFEEILMISKGEFDQPLEESKVAKKYNVELSDVQLMQEAQILTNTLDISKLEGTKLAELIGIQEEQLKQLVAVQQGDFQAMKEAGVFKQLGFDKEEVLFEQLYNAALKDDLQNTLLETAGAFYAAGSLYGDKSATSGATANPLAALANAGLLKGSLDEQQINVITLLLDLATGNKKANQVGIDDIKSILETQGFSEKEIAVIQLLQKMSGGDFEYSTLEEAGIFEELGLTADQLQKLQIAYDLMQKPINFKNVADSGIFKGTDLEDSGAIDLLLKIESDEPGSIDQVKDMATLLGVTEEQMSQIEAIYAIDGQSKSLTTQQLIALQKVVGFDLNEQQITVL
jgi:plasmid maintenance system antidote protein VapI